MKVKCKPRSSDKRKESQDRGYLIGRLWNQSLPFNVNPRGVLIHRVRTGITYFRKGNRSHDAVTYWCSNSAVHDGLCLTDNPPLDRLLCSRCEILAVEAGEPTAEQLTGRHVCIGVMKAHRLCCRNEGN